MPDLSGLKLETVTPAPAGGAGLSGLKLTPPTAITELTPPMQSVTQGADPIDIPSTPEVEGNALTELTPEMEAVTQGFEPSFAEERVAARGTNILESVERATEGKGALDIVKDVATSTLPLGLQLIQGLISKKQTPAETQLQIGGQTAGLAADIAFKGIGDVLTSKPALAFHDFVSPIKIEELKPAFELVGGEIAKTEVFQEGLKALQSTIEDFQQFAEDNPRVAGDIEGALGLVEFLPAAELTGSVINLLKRGAPTLLGLFKNSPTKARQFIADVRKTPEVFQLPIDKRIAELERLAVLADEAAITELSLKERLAGVSVKAKRRIFGKRERLEKFINQSEKAALDDTEISAIAFGAKEVGETFKKLQTALSDTGSSIGKFRRKMGAKKAAPTDIDTSITTFTDGLRDRGLKVKADGTLIAEKGRTPVFSSGEIKKLQEFHNDLLSLKKDPNLLNVVDVQNKLREQIKFGKQAGELSSAVETVINPVQKTLNNAQRNVIGPVESARLDEFSQLIGIVQDFNAATAKGKNTEFLIKRLLSDKDRLPKELIEKIKEITGDDILDTARFAKIATDVVADPEQLGLFKQAVEGAGLNITDILAGGPAVKARGGFKLIEKAVGIDAKKVFLEAATPPKKSINLRKKAAKLRARKR
jgi:hypothetical protein